MNDEMLKPVLWTGSSNDDLKRFPEPVRRRLRIAERHYRETRE